MTLPYPSRAEAERMLEGLADGTTSPEEADEWACPYVVHDDAYDRRTLTDDVWFALCAAFGSDMQTALGVYLYGPIDFGCWLEKFRSIRSAERGVGSEPDQAFGQEETPGDTAPGASQTR